MKRQMWFYIIFVLLVSCKKNNDTVELNIINKEIYAIDNTLMISQNRYKYSDNERKFAKNIITYKLTNNTNINYFFVLNEDITSKEPDIINTELCLDCKNSNINFSILDQNNKIPKYYSGSGDSFMQSKGCIDPEIYKIESVRHHLKELNIPIIYGDYKFSNAVIKNSFILHPNESKYFRSIIYLPFEEVDDYNFIFSRFEFDKKSKYNFNFVYTCDSKQIEKVLPNYKKEELKENNVKIYTGKLISNKVPVKMISMPED